MKKCNLLVAAVFTAGLVLVLPGAETDPGAFALDPGRAQAGSGTADTALFESVPLFEGPQHEMVRTGAILAHDDGSAEIHTGSVTEPLVVANRFVPGECVPLSSVSFYTSGAAAGDLAEIVIYEDPSGLAPAPDPSMEVLREEIILGEGGFQLVDLGGLALNVEGSPEAAFFVGLANVAPRSFSLGVDMSGTRGGVSFISEDGGLRFVAISEFPVMDGIAMIRARRAGAVPLRDRIRGRVRMGKAAEPLSGESESSLHIGSPSGSTRGDGTRATLLNDNVTASSGSGSCPSCSPALTPGYPMFTVGSPDLYEDYMTIENSSGSGIAMPIRTVLDTLTPVSVEAFNPDGGGARPPDGYWEYSLANNDGTTSADNVLDPGEKITRLWKVADEAGDIFTFWVDVYSGYGADGNTTLLLHGDGDDSASKHTLESHGHPRFETVEKKFGASSMYFDGSADYMTVPNDNDWDFATEAFTIDFWFFFNQFHGNCDGLVTKIRDGTLNSWGIYRNGNHLHVRGARSDQSDYYYETPSTIETGRWYHAAFVYSGGVLRFYLDGAIEIQENIGSGMFNNGLSVTAGSGADGGTLCYDASMLDGYIDELRISRGIARWTSNFTPPAGPYGPDSYTKLLLHFDGDESDSAHPATIVGDTKIVASQSKWDGSLYFDGNGDYLNIPDSEDLELGSGDFTIDCWVNFSSIASTKNFIAKKTSPGGLPWDGYLFGISNGTIRFLGSTSGSAWDWIFQDGISISTGTWYHFAAVRNGSEFKYYINGVQIGATRTVSGSLFNNTGEFRVGSVAGYGEYMYGYLDEVRVSKGVARWTSNFTPPSEPY